MPGRTLQKVPFQTPLDFEQKPLHGFREYLRQLTVNVVLLRGLLVELKEVIVILALISFFVWGVVQLFTHLHR